MSATDELRRMLDESGIKHFDYSKSGWSQTQWEAPDGNRHFTYETYNNHAKTAKLVISWFPTPEQAIAATLGGGKLTAEQVRESIERNFSKVAVLDDGKPVEWRDDWVCKVGIDYKSIADELNATPGGGECEHSGTRWHELFGTPERAAKTLSIMQRCELGIIGNCDECEMHDACRVRDGDYDALLKWLGGDAE